jgi:hypothetical protein
LATRTKKRDIAGQAATQTSDSKAVDAFLKDLNHPLVGLAKGLRKVILAADHEIGEEIKWNAPAFFYTGAMRPFDPKEYRREGAAHWHKKTGERS